jgi:hypothetical protein
MTRQLSDSEINHLRRLLGWVRCEVGQSPDEMLNTAKSIAPAIGEVSDEGKQRMVEAYAKSANVPAYIRAAIKALEKVFEPKAGEVVDAEICDPRNSSSLPRTTIGGPR